MIWLALVAIEQRSSDKVKSRHTRNADPGRLPCFLLLFLSVPGAALEKANICRGLAAFLLVFSRYKQEVPQTRRGALGRPHRAASAGIASTPPPSPAGRAGGGLRCG